MIKFKWLNIFGLLASFLVMVAALILHPMVSDDFCLADGVRSTPSFYDYLKSYYFKTNGRSVAACFYYFFYSSVGLMIVMKFISAVMFLTIIYFAAMIAARQIKDPSIRLFCFVWSLSIIWFGTPSLNEVLFWGNASVVYTWGLFFCIMLVAPYLTIITTNKDDKLQFLPVSKFLLIPIGFISGSCQEQLLIPVTIVFFLFIYKCKREKNFRRHSKILWTSMGAYYFSFACMAFAPSNLRRMTSVINGESSSVQSISVKIFHIYDYFVSLFLQIDGSSVLPWILAFVFSSCYLFSGSIKIKNNYLFWIFLAMSIGALLPIMLTGFKTTAPRTTFVSFYFMVCASISTLKMQFVPNDSRRVKLVTFVLIVFIFMDMVNSGRSAFYYYKQNKDRDNFIMTQGVKKKSIELIPFYTLLHRTMYFADINNKKDDLWINECVCGFYKLDTLTVKK